jgi:hypothetical protein
MTQMTFSENLRKRLDGINIKPYRLALLSGLNVQHCYKIVKGERNPSDETLEELASVRELNLTLDELRAWRSLSKVKNVSSLLSSIPEDLLLAELQRRYPDPAVRAQKVAEYLNRAQESHLRAVN